MLFAQYLLSTCCPHAVHMQTFRFASKRGCGLVFSNMLSSRFLFGVEFFNFYFLLCHCDRQRSYRIVHCVLGKQAIEGESRSSQFSKSDREVSVVSPSPLFLSSHCGHLADGSSSLFFFSGHPRDAIPMQEHESLLNTRPGMSSLRSNSEKFDRLFRILCDAIPMQEHDCQVTIRARISGLCSNSEEFESLFRILCDAIPMQENDSHVTIRARISGLCSNVEKFEGLFRILCDTSPRFLGSDSSHLTDGSSSLFSFWRPPTHCSFRVVVVVFSSGWEGRGRGWDTLGAGGLCPPAPPRYSSAAICCSSLVTNRRGGWGGVAPPPSPLHHHVSFSIHLT